MLHKNETQQELFSTKSNHKYLRVQYSRLVGPSSYIYDHIHPKHMHNKDEGAKTQLSQLVKQDTKQTQNSQNTHAMKTPE